MIRNSYKNELFILERLRSTSSVSVDVINHHVTPSADNVHGEILTFCTPWNNVPP